MEVRVWPMLPHSDMAKIGPTWVEIHAAIQEEEIIKEQDSTWEDIVSRQFSGGVEEEDRGVDRGRSVRSGAPVQRCHQRRGRRG